MSLDRRTFLGATAAAGLVLAGGKDAVALNRMPAAVAPVSVPDYFLDSLADEGKLALPRGIKARRVTTIGVEDLRDNRGGKVIGKTPSNLDGTGCFEVRGGIRLVVNHECRANADVVVPLVKGTVYDDGVPSGMGGNTVVETTRSGEFVQQWVGLSGTIRNCAGGETPWGSWLSCEEDTSKAGAKVKAKDGKEYTLKKDHGYVFEVFPDTVAKQLPMPIKAWGRAVWEGASIDPDRTKAYMTEDTGGGLFYRWIAPQGKKIGPGIARMFGEKAGVVQAAQLVKNGKGLVHYGELEKSDLDKAYPVKWVDGGEDRQAQKTDLRKQFPGATVHPKIEGQWSDGKGLWFTLSYVSAGEATKYGVDEDQGMVMYYDYAAETLTLKVYFGKGDYFDSPDNITVSPWGTLVIAEDGSDPNHLIAWTPKSGAIALVKDNAERGEWAGPTFNKSGNMLFAAIQSDCVHAFSGNLGRFLRR